MRKERPRFCSGYHLTASGLEGTLVTGKQIFQGNCCAFLYHYSAHCAHLSRCLRTILGWLSRIESAHTDFRAAESFRIHKPALVQTCVPNFGNNTTSMFNNLSKLYYPKTSALTTFEKMKTTDLKRKRREKCIRN